MLSGDELRKTLKAADELELPAELRAEEEEEEEEQRYILGLLLNKAGRHDSCPKVKSKHLDGPRVADD